jgi:hypothetical protein
MKILLTKQTCQISGAAEIFSGSGAAASVVVNARAEQLADMFLDKPCYIGFPFLRESLVRVVVSLFRLCL